MLKPSFAHRLLRITPGKIPRLLLNPSSCGASLDLMSLAGSMLLLAALIVWRVSPSSWPLIYAICTVTIALFCLEIGLSDCERLARARIRRGECVWCGAKCDHPHLDNCPRN